MPPTRKKLTKNQQEALRLRRESMKRGFPQITAPTALPQLYPPFIPAFPPPTNSEFQKYAHNGTDFQIFGNNMFAWRILLQGTMLAPNYMKAEKRINEFTFFIVDFFDLQYLNDLLHKCETARDKKNTLMRSFRRMSTWVKVYKDHTAYLRYVPLLTDKKNQEAVRFFVEDVLEIIQVVKFKQDCPLRHNDERLRKYQDLWKLEHRKKIYETISMEELGKVFDEFGCDKNLVKLIEDPLQHIARREYLERGGYIRTITQSMVNVMPAQMAGLYILDALIKGVNWNKYQCPGHTEEGTSPYKCRDGMKALIMKHLREVAAKKFSYVNIKNLIDIINQYRSACIESYTPPISNPDYMFNGLPYTTDINIILYMFPASVYEFPYFANILSEKQEDIPVWMAKVFIGLGWLVQFFEDQKPDDQFVALFVGEALLYMVPDEHWERAQLFIRNVLNKVVIGSHNYPSLLEFAKVMPSQALTKKQKKAAKRRKQKAKQKIQTKPPTADELLDPQKGKADDLQFENETNSKAEEEVVFESDFEDFTESEDEFLDTDTFSDPGGSSERGSESPSELLTNFCALIVQDEILEPKNYYWRYSEEFEPDETEKSRDESRRRPTMRHYSPEKVYTDGDIQKLTEQLDRIVSHNNILEKRLQDLQETYRIQEEWKLQGAEEQNEQSSSTSSIAQYLQSDICPTFMVIRDLELENAELTQINSELLDKNRELETFVKEVLDFLRDK